MTNNRKARRTWEAALRKHQKRGCCVHIWYQHDNWCGIHTAEHLCNCNPDRVLTDHLGRVLARVEGAGFFDPFEVIEACNGRP